MVIIGRDIDFTYDKLFHIIAAVGRGAVILATNPDMYHPGEGDYRVPETGSLTAAVEAILLVKIDFVGKPACSIFQHIMSHFHVYPHKSVMIGDTLETDIIGGRHAGMTTIVLEQPCIPRQVYREEGTRADFSVANFSELYGLIYGYEGGR